MHSMLTGLLHSVKPSLARAGRPKALPRVLDASFATSGLDAGYLTLNRARELRLFYDTDGTSADVIALDERLRIMYRDGVGACRPPF